MHSTQRNKKNELLYLLSSDEPLLLQEARDEIINRCKNSGFKERHVLCIENQDDWFKFESLTQNMGLFGEQQLIDLRLSNAKIDKSIQQRLIQYTEQNSPDTIVILSCAKLTAAQKKAKWFLALAPYMQAQFIWPLQPQQRAPWIQQRLRKYNITADNDSLKQLIEQTQGNLLATDQILQKLALCYPNQHITIKQMASAMVDGAKFSVFDLANAALAGHTKQLMHALNYLQFSGTESILVLWALTREIRELYQLVGKYESGTPLNRLLATQWATRKPLLQAAVQRLSLCKLRLLLHQAQKIDGMIKGVQLGNAWQQLQRLALQLAGVTL